MEALFAELKNQIGLRRLRLRRRKFVREQFLLAATAQNLKRLVQFLTRNSLQPVPAASYERGRIRKERKPVISTQEITSEGRVARKPESFNSHSDLSNVSRPSPVGLSAAVE